MPQCFVSRQGVLNSGYFEVIRPRFIEKYINSDFDTRVVMDGLLLQYIGEFDSLLRHPAVRGPLNPRMHTPEVDENSTTGTLLKRMKRQVNSICILADLAHTDTPANAAEAAVQSRADQVFHQLYDLVVRPPSSSGSHCANNSD